MPFRKWRPWSKEPFISIKRAFVRLLATRVLGSLGYQADAALPIMPACAAYQSTELFPIIREKTLLCRLSHEEKLDFTSVLAGVRGGGVYCVATLGRKGVVFLVWQE